VEQWCPSDVISDVLWSLSEDAVHPVWRHHLGWGVSRTSYHIN